MSMTSEIELLAESIASLVLSRAVPQPTFWDYADIAHNLRASKSTVARWVTLPDFPRPIRPPTKGPGLAHPIYKPAEVIAWAGRHQEGASGRVGRPRKAA